jgi:phosphoglycolate phosphatase-like HAD superfamily hydrolase
MAYDGLLLDHDGVLVTLADRPSLRRAAAGALSDAGVAAPTPGDVDAITIGVDAADVHRLGETYGVDPGTLWRHRDDRIASLLHDATRDGRKRPYDDVDALADLALPLGVVSNNQTRIVRDVLGHHGLADLFGTVRARDPTLDSLARKKPRPDFLQAAMADLGVEDPLYVGDSESDVEAALACDLDVAFLRRPHNADRTLAVEPTHDVTGLDAVAALL